MKWKKFYNFEIVKKLLVKMISCLVLDNYRDTKMETYFPSELPSMYTHDNLLTNVNHRKSINIPFVMMIVSSDRFWACYCIMCSPS